VTGEEQDVEVFVSILGASQYIYVEASETQQLEDFLASNANALSKTGAWIFLQSKLRK